MSHDFFIEFYAFFSDSLQLYTPLNIFVALVGVEVWTDSDEMTLSPKGDTTLRNFLNYRREMLVKEIPNDNAQLLTWVFRWFSFGILIASFWINRSLIYAVIEIHLFLLDFSFFWILLDFSFKKILLEKIKFFYRCIFIAAYS